jgi:hypothetical protein
MPSQVFRAEGAKVAALSFEHERSRNFHDLPPLIVLSRQEGNIRITMRIPFCIAIFEKNFYLTGGRIKILYCSRKPLEGFFKNHLYVLAATGQWSRNLLEFEARAPYIGIGGVGALATH